MPNVKKLKPNTLKCNHLTPSGLRGLNRSDISSSGTVVLEEKCLLQYIDTLQRMLYASAVKNYIIPEMTYYVSSGALNPTQSLLSTVNASGITDTQQHFLVFSVDSQPSTDVLIVFQRHSDAVFGIWNDFTLNSS